MCPQNVIFVSCITGAVIPQRFKTQQGYTIHKITQIYFRMWSCNNYYFFWVWKPAPFSLARYQVLSLKPFMFSPHQFSPFFLTNGFHECLESWEEGLAPSQARLTCFLSRQLPIRKGQCSFIGLLHLSLMHATKLFIEGTNKRCSRFIPP